MVSTACSSGSSVRPSTYRKNKAKNTYFLAASEMVPMIDLLKPICLNIEHSKKHGVEAYDAHLKTEVVLTSDISLLVSDYHMMSLACNHMGPSANKFCPKCLVDQSSPFEKCELRTAQGTQRTLERLKLQSNTSARSKLEKQSGTKLFENCLWNYIDPHRDTPVGVLHFFYLGLAKHLVQFCLKSLSANQVQLLEVHLSSIDQTGFRYRINGETFIKYLESRQGKDFKTYLQIAPHNMSFAGLKRTYVKALERLALISKHVQQSKPYIETELEEYMAYVERKIPELGAKKKTHFCLHIGDDIQRHGNPLNYIEDPFEKNIGPIRNCIQHQNGHARSRDTVMQFMKSELTKHIISGGFIKIDTEWKCADNEVLRYGDQRKIRSYLGMSEQEEDEPGQLKNAVRTENRKLQENTGVLDELELMMAAIAADTDLCNLKRVFQYRSVVTSDGQVAHVGSFVLYQHNSKNNIGTLKKIVQIQGTRQENFQIAFMAKADQIRDDSFGNQRITLSNITEVIRTRNIICSVHILHDCQEGSCRVVQKSRARRMEQEQTSSIEFFLKHNTECNVYILNKYRLDKLEDKLVLS